MAVAGGKSKSLQEDFSPSFSVFLLLTKSSHHINCPRHILPRVQYLPLQLSASPVMALTVQHDSNFPDQSYRQGLKEAFVKDCIIEAAVEHLFIELYKNDLLGLFVRAFKPEVVKTKHSAGFNQTVHFSWDYGLCPPPDAPLDPLQPFLKGFVQNLTSYDPETGIDRAPVEQSRDVREVVEEYIEAILQYARLMLDSIGEKSDSDEEEDDQEEGSQVDGDTGKATDTNCTVQSDTIEDASIGTTDESDEVTTTPESPGTFGDIIKWSFHSPDRRFADFGTQIVVERLKEVIGGAEANAAFCCGGCIPIVIADGTGNTSVNNSPPVIVRFDTATGGTHKVTFSGNAGPALFGVNYLVQQCQPATFGVGSREVHNQEFRNAVKLDATQFSTNLDPYNLGILDSVSKTLLPLDGTADACVRPSNKLRAELRNLNVYTGPSGKFKSHVDTPKTPNQVGTLVICLPSKHEGGNLIVRHQDRNVTFTWEDSMSIEWAAFYSHLEHEVEEVKSGHRVTLTYSLFWRESLQSTESLPSPATVASLPLYGELRKIMSLGSFLPKGGTLGLYCTHSYIHNRKSKEVDMPRSLKGVDMAFFMACQQLGLNIYTRPVRDPKEMEWYDEYMCNSDSEVASDDALTGDEEGYYDQRRLLHDENSPSVSDEVVLKYDYDGGDWKTKSKGTASSCGLLS